MLNAVFALVATYLLSKYQNDLNKLKGKQYQLVASMYWAMVFMCFLGCVVIIAGNGYLYYALVFIDKESDEVFGFRITNDITVATLAIIEFIASISTAHNPKFFIPHLIRRTLCCNQCCYCCGSQSRRHILRKAILSVAMWIILLFIQLATSSLLPIVIIIVINPVPSLAFLSIMVSLFFCIVVFIAYFLNAFEGNYISRHRLSKQERRKSTISLSELRKDWEKASGWARNKVVLIAQAFVFLVIFVTIALVIIIYLNFVKAGADTNNAGGLIFSLVPSVALGGLTWAAKKHMFKELEDEEEKETAKGDLNEDEDVRETLLQIGNISFGPKTRRKSRKKSLKRKGINSLTHLVSDTSIAAGLDSDSGTERAEMAIDQPEMVTVVSNAGALSKEIDHHGEEEDTARREQWNEALSKEADHHREEEDTAQRQQWNEALSKEADQKKEEEEDTVQYDQWNENQLSVEVFTSDTVAAIMLGGEEGDAQNGGTPSEK